MPVWPFKRRKRADTIGHPEREPIVSEKPTKLRQANSEPASSPATAVPARASVPGPTHVQLDTLQKLEGDREVSVEWSEKTGKVPQGTDKENISPQQHVSSEDVTALPFFQTLQQSPHLRPADPDRPPIPYNFRPMSMSQTSFQRLNSSGSKPPRPHTLHSKRSTTDYGTPARRTSTRHSRRKDEALREEVIRAMCEPMPIPKRQGEGPLRRESKKIRGLGEGTSASSIPADDSSRLVGSNDMEQRGWEIGGIASVFTARPAIRLSGIPQNVVSTSLAVPSSGILYRIESKREKQKRSSVNRDAPRTPRKKKTVGDEADELGASDLRLLMERDAKRKERKQRERQEQLERKLQERQGRNRGDSDLRRRDTLEQKRIDEDRARAEEQIAAQGALTPPTAVHPALRSLQSEEAIAAPVGLGIEKDLRTSDPMDVDRQEFSTPGAIAEEPEHELTNHTAGFQNPFTDDARAPAPASLNEHPATQSATSLPSGMETPLDEPVIATAQAIRMSQTNTPPLSPVYGTRAASSASQLPPPARQQSMSALSASAQSVSSLSKPPAVSTEKQAPDSPKERRGTAWASFFRRSTTLRRGQGAPGESTSATSFSNTSRESMRNQPLPAHLVDPQARRPSNVRTKSGAPVRTQSKFREDLPETPVSPPESPDVTTMAAAVAAARRNNGKLSLQQADASGSSEFPDNPGTEKIRGHSAMAPSLASIDSEGSWLAGPGNRQSIQSALSRSYSKRNAEQFTGSFENLGTDQDAEVVKRNSVQPPHRVDGQTIAGADPAEESEPDDTVVDTQGSHPTVHGSVRRKATLIQHAPRLKSREGLVSEYAAMDPSDAPSEAASEVYATPFEIPMSDSEDEQYFAKASPEPELERATSVAYSGRHSRKFSAGSARLLDLRPLSKTATPEPPDTASVPSTPVQSHST